MKTKNAKNREEAKLIRKSQAKISHDDSHHYKEEEVFRSALDFVVEERNNFTSLQCNLYVNINIFLY